MNKKWRIVFFNRFDKPILNVDVDAPSAEEARVKGLAEIAGMGTPHRIEVQEIRS